MTISEDLFLSILALDAYNRGYDEGIAGLGGIGSKVGAATIKRQSGIKTTDESVAAGFYTIGAGAGGLAAGT